MSTDVLSPDVEQQPLETIVREVMIILQNSSGAVLTLNTFSLTAGQWDPNAPSGLPKQGLQIGPGNSPTWGNATETPFTGVAGSMNYSANAVTLAVAWTWAYGSPPSASVSVNGSSTLSATFTLANTTSTTATLTVSVSGQA